MCDELVEIEKEREQKEEERASSPQRKTAVRGQRYVGCRRASSVGSLCEGGAANWLSGAPSLAEASLGTCSILPRLGFRRCGTRKGPAQRTDQARRCERMRVWQRARVISPPEGDCGADVLWHLLEGYSGVLRHGERLEGVLGRHVEGHYGMWRKDAEKGG